MSRTQAMTSRDGLLEAAGRVFAEVGYQDATIRQIVERAGASLGAVNYHFRDKAGLYREVLTRAHHETIDRFREAAADPDAERRLTRFVGAMLSVALTEGDAETWAARVLASEMLDPGPEASREIFRKFIRPRLDILKEIVRGLLGPDADEATVLRHAMSVVGQCALYLHKRSVVEIAHGRALSDADVEPLTRHIAGVSLAGMRAEAAKAGRTDPIPTAYRNKAGKDGGAAP